MSPSLLLGRLRPLGFLFALCLFACQRPRASGQPRRSDKGQRRERRARAATRSRTPGLAGASAQTEPGVAVGLKAP
jgi:hypothetical protein